MGKEGWQLTTGEKKRILLNNIYGVDIDAAAAEVTKLSLLLKVLEGESAETLGKNLKLFHERALPDLGNNIKCGNSLIGTDFYEGRQMGLLDEDERLRINAFDWDVEFPEIFSGKNPGFDAVIGNPPYVRMEAFQSLKEYLKLKYESHDERSDLYVYFIERGHSLVNNSGSYGMIVSNKFIRAKYGKNIRKFITNNATIEQIIDFSGLPVFVGATVRPIILITSRQRKGVLETKYSPPVSEDIFASLLTGTLTIDKAIEDESYTILRDSLTNNSWSFLKPEAVFLISKMTSAGVSLETYSQKGIGYGIKTGLERAFVINEQERESIIEQDTKALEIIKPYIVGRNVRRFFLNFGGLYLIYTYHGIEIDKYPFVEKYLRSFKSQLEKRATKQKWYELQQPQLKYVSFYEKPKIVFPDIANKPRFALDEIGFYGATTTFFIGLYDLYLLGLLNSRMSYFYFLEKCAALEGKADRYLRFKYQYLKEFPVRPIDFSNPADKARHDHMVEMVEQMLELNKQLQAAKISHEKNTLQRQIDATDRRIDKLVYELYELTDKEIMIVEEGCG